MHKRAGAIALLRERPAGEPEAQQGRESCPRQRRSHSRAPRAGQLEAECDERELECPKHGSEFDLRTGEPRSLPAVRPVPRYLARVVDGDVVVELTTEATP